MITYKPSSRLGALNEEDFKSDATARGWIVSNTGGSTVSYDGTNGFKITTGLSTTTNISLTNNTTKFMQYLSLYFRTPSGSRYATSPKIAVYLNEVKVVEASFDLAGNTAYEGEMNINIFKSTPNDYKYNYIVAQQNSIVTYYSGTVNVNSNGTNVIRIDFDGRTGSDGVTTQYWYMTNLKWV